MLDQAFESLQKYTWGDDRKLLDPIDKAIVESQRDPDARKALEARLIAVLDSDATRNGKDFVCRKLKVMGTEACVPTLAKMLGDPTHSHMARYALQEMEVPAAAQALRDSLSSISDDLKIGVMGSLGARQDAEAVPVLASLLQNPATAASAAKALGAIRTAEAAKVLAESKSTANGEVMNSLLACAESMLAGGNKVGALSVYKNLSKKGDLPKHVKLAATKGMLACAGK